MPRQARIVIPGELFHLTQRGNYQQNIYDEDNDKIQYLKYFDKYSQEYGLDIFAYCLMNNHIHFIVRPMKQESMAQVICRAHQRYSVYFHRKNERKGHLWQERYYSCLVEGSHVDMAVRYVECNPVRAGLVEKPWQYGFSSARAHLGTDYKIVTLKDISEYIDVKSWREFLLEDEKEEALEELRRATVRGLVFGNSGNSDRH